MNEIPNVNIILDYIKANKLTKKEFCKQCDITLSTFYRIINGKNVKVMPLVKIVKKMNIRLQQLFE